MYKVCYCICTQMYTKRTHKTMSNSEIISFRLNTQQLEALEALGEEGETRQATAKRIVLAAIGGTPQVSPVPQDVLDGLRGEFIDRLNTQSGSINEVLSEQWQAIKALREEIKALQLVGIQDVHSSKPTEEISPQEKPQEESIQAVYNCVQEEEGTHQEVITPGEDLSDGQSPASGDRNQGDKAEITVSGQAGKKLLDKKQIINRRDNIKKKMKPNDVSGTIIENKLVELYPHHSDWFLDDGKPNKLMAAANYDHIIKAIQTELNQ